MQYASIILGNLALVWMCYRDQTDLGELLWIFWLQSVLIGLAAVARMSLLRQFSTDGFTTNDKATPETAQAKNETIGFFILHYGFFHVIYAVFLTTMFAAPWTAVSLWGGSVVVAFAIGEIVYVVQRAASDRSWRPNLGTLMFTPYIRVVPMHMAILTTGFAGQFGTGDYDGPLVFFLLLKTGADLGMQIVDDRLETRWRDAQDASSR